MNETKNLFVYGTRPELIKLWPVIEKTKDKYVVCTGQHKNLLDKELLIPDLNLNLMRHGASSLSVLDKVMGTMSWVLEYRKPKRVIVQGDTATAFGTALAAFHGGYPIYHVEAGLRTWDKDQPFPEEVYRQGITSMADTHFCPTSQNAANVNKTMPYRRRLYITGNPVIDAVQALAPENPTLKEDVIVTLHRRESPVEEYGKALIQLIEDNPRFNFKVIVHPNRIGQRLKRILDIDYCDDNLRLLYPMDYLAFLRELASCYLVLTDSGGLQEEAPALNKPVIVMREKTERPEGLGLTSRLAKPDELVNLTERLLYDKTEYFLTASAKNPFGDGKASGRIAEVLNA